MDIVRVEVFDDIEGHQTHRLTVKDIVLLLGYQDLRGSVRTVNGFQVIEGGRADSASSNSNHKVAGKNRHHLKLLSPLGAEGVTGAEASALAS
jgi:hypothetical protein